MAQLGNVLRWTFTGARIEETSGFLPWQKKVRDQDIWLHWRAETRRREGADLVQEVVAEGRMTGAEVRWWAGWFGNAPKIRNFPAKLGDTPTDPVARLWTPLAGQAVEFFLWPERLGGFVLLALFTPDETRPYARIAVEANASPEDLSTFGQAIEAEYEGLKDTAKKE